VTKRPITTTLAVPTLTGLLTACSDDRGSDDQAADHARGAVAVGIIRREAALIAAGTPLVVAAAAWLLAGRTHLALIAHDAGSS
jgi:hypothetical protein